MNFPTAAGEVETHKFQLSIVYHLLLFSVGVRRLPRSRFLASVMLSKDSTRTELGKRPIPTRRVGHNLNTITYRRSLLSRQPNSYHRGYRKDKREDNLVSHSLLLFGYSGNNQVTSSPGWDRHRTTRPGPRCVPPFFLFHYPLVQHNPLWSPTHKIDEKRKWVNGIGPEISSSHLYCVQFWFSFGWCHWYHCKSKGGQKTRVLPIGEVPYPKITRANAHNTLSSPTFQPQQTLKQLNFEHSLKTKKKKKDEIEKYIHIPHATKLPVGAYAHVMTHDERRGMACTCTARKRHAVKNIGRPEFNRSTTKTVLFCCVKSGTAQKTKTNLVRGVSIPNDQFSILRCTHKIPAHWSRKRHRESLANKKQKKPSPASSVKFFPLLSGKENDCCMPHRESFAQCIA